MIPMQRTPGPSGSVLSQRLLQVAHGPDQSLFADPIEVSPRQEFGCCFPFGIEENRPTWEQMLLYTYQQGIAHKHVAPEDIFPKGIMTHVVV